MVIKSQRILKFKIKCTIGIFITLLLLIVSTDMVQAAPDCIMDDGEIIITIESKPATHSIRYRTLGFTVTTQYQENEVTAKGIKGPAAPPNPCRILPLEYGEKNELERTKDRVITEYRYSEEIVKYIIKDIIDLDKTTEDTYLYFNAIFQTYKIVGGKEIVLNPRITTWKGIVNDQNWVNINVFKEYFNRRVKFKPGLQPNSLYYEIENNVIFQGDLANMKIGEELKWNREVTTTTTIKNTPCKLIGYYAKSKLTGKEVTGTRKMVGEKTKNRSLTPEDIINDSVKVLYGGMDIHMIFEPLGADIVINAIDIDTGETICSEMYTGTVSPGEDFNQTIDNIITANGITYRKTEKFYYTYLNKGNKHKTIVSEEGLPSDPIKIKIPQDLKMPSTITVEVYYKSSDIMMDEIKLRVIMVSKKGDLIEEISKELVVKEQVINKQAEYIRKVAGVTYTYLDKWDYTYTLSTENITKDGTGSKLEFTIPSKVKLGTEIILKLYYDVSQSVEIPEESSPISLSLDSPSPYAIINGDNYTCPLFISKEGISTTESQHVYVKSKEYLLGYRLINKTGKIKFHVPVSMTYTLKYYTATPEEYGGPQEVIDTVVDTQYIPVERAYSYWEIGELEYYIPSSAHIYNYSLPDGRVNLTSNDSFLNVPSLITRHSSNVYDHIILPKQAREGIKLTKETPFTSETNDRPMVEFEDLSSYVHAMTGELTVKNDFISFNGEIVLSDQAVEKISSRPNTSSLIQTTKITHDKVLFTEGQIINAIKENGLYTSHGTINYRKHHMSINSDSSKSFNISVNNVLIHTPVICEPIIDADNDRWVQLINPNEEAYQIVLDPDTSLNDFTVRISNTLPHSDRLGYYNRDFSRSFIDPDNISYIAKREGIVRNEMKLPFDAYIDEENDLNPENDQFIKAGTWIVLGRSKQRFYVPMWVQEGTYTAHFRTIAVNGEEKLSNTETTRNTNHNNYVATSTSTFQISGRVYGLTLYDISDDGRWKEIFRIKDTMMFKHFEGGEDGTKRNNYHSEYGYYYTVGTKNQYGHETGRYNKYTLPLVNGSHPKYKNLGALKTGYAFRFMLDSTGEMYGAGCQVRIKPSFYHVDEKGNKRQLVDIYYDEEIEERQHVLVKIGEGIDLVNLNYGTSGNPYSRIPEAELRHTAKVIGTTYSKIVNQYGSMYSYSEVRLTSLFRTFIGLDYASSIVELPSYTKVSEHIKEDELGLSKYMQRWYGTYKLPTNVHVAPKGYNVYDHLKRHGIDYTEDFWLRDGYIIVNFNIETIDKKGNRNLSYINGANYLYKDNCSMWITEGAMLQKTDNRDVTFNLKAGDIVLYYTDKKYSDDYIGLIY